MLKVTSFVQYVYDYTTGLAVQLSVSVLLLVLIFLILRQRIIVHHPLYTCPHNQAPSYAVTPIEDIAQLPFSRSIMAAYLKLNSGQTLSRNKSRVHVKYTRN